MKFGTVGAQLFHTDKQEKANSRF